MIIIVHPSNPVNQLRSRDIESIYLFKKSTWGNRVRIFPINLPPRDPLREELSKKWIDRSSGEIENFYLMRALSGQGQPPIIVGTPEEVKTYIKNNRGAIGYIHKKDLDDSVKVIPILEKEPGQ